MRTPCGLIHFYAGRTATASRIPVILVHGPVIASRYMLPTLRHVAPFCHVYAVDLSRGHPGGHHPGSSSSKMARNLVHMEAVMGAVPARGRSRRSQVRSG
jgi:hypothetical protein